MKILLTGATGYIAKRLLPVLLAEGHEIICCVRDKIRFDTSRYRDEKLSVIELNFLEKESLDQIPHDIDVAYYLIHSMSAANGDFEEMEEISAINFKEKIQQTQVKQVIYLSGIVNGEKLSKHLDSRKNVEAILASGNFNLTTLRAGIIVGSGSASFEIIRDLVEKLPIMITPKWLNTRSQPIAIRNVIDFMKGVVLKEYTYNKSFDIGGPEILTYKEMLLRFAQIRGLKRRIFTIPIMTPRFSSYWLFFVTSTSYKLAVNLVNSMSVEVICRKNNLHELLGIKILTYDEAIKLAFDKIKQQDVLSSWTDALSSQILDEGIDSHIEIPVFGCYTDKEHCRIANDEKVLEKIWTLGGHNGWYYANWLWGLRGIIDKMVGGVGLRRGRRNDKDIEVGDALDFWRVLYASKRDKRLLLYAEMKIPGEAWLEFKIVDGVYYQTATFRPLGIWGRTYWYAVAPFHIFIFKGLMHKIVN